MNHSKAEFKEYPKTVDPNDFWGQVRRTVNGKPVSEQQIALIVTAVRNGLQFDPGDVVLDLACGNGALSSYFYNDFGALHGVDLSPYLIEVATRNFLVAGKSTFSVDDAAHYTRSEPAPSRFSKVLCYGSFSYFSESDARAVLRDLNRNFVNVSRIFIGNLPDGDRADRFYPPGTNYAPELKDHTAQIGVWRSEEELRALVSAEGWNLEVAYMPETFYASHYRFDAILTRQDVSM